MKGMSVNLTDTGEFTPLHVCAEFGHLEAIKTLVEGGVAINYTDRDVALHSLWLHSKAN
jgi:ankyrin repeat protein